MAVDSQSEVQNPDPPSAVDSQSELQNPDPPSAVDKVDKFIVAVAIAVGSAKMVAP
jgi:hypothetical protein